MSTVPLWRHAREREARAGGLPVDRDVERSLAGLKWLNGLVAAMQVGFGPFLALYLTAQLWDAGKIGLALSLGTAMAMAAQVPAGALVDLMHSKPLAAGSAIVGIVAAAWLIAAAPVPPTVIAALGIQAIASGVLTPAIAAITLALSRHKELGERLGKNVRYAAIGSALSAACMGPIGYWFSPRATLLAAGAFGVAALFAMRAIHPGDLASAPSRTEHAAVAPPGEAGPPCRFRDVCLNRRLLICAACIALFQLGNAAVMPLAVTTVTRANGRLADLVIPAAVIVPQALTALLSPWFGRKTESWGRRPVALVGLAALPIRILLFAVNDDPYLMVLYQALDGISASVIGVMLPLIVADLTHEGGRFNFGMGFVGLISGLGATLSTALGGAIAARFGVATAFAALAVAGFAAVALAWWEMPDTAPTTQPPLTPQRTMA